MLFRSEPIDPSLWKFLRLRPSNFPTLRIAQFAQLIHTNNGLFSKILNADDIRQLAEHFKTSVSPFWRSHYTFSKSRKQSDKRLGKDAMGLIIVNSVIPFIFAYGKYHSNEMLVQRALCFLEELSPENNTIIRMWEELGITSSNAGRTQALIHQIGRAHV